MSGKLDQSLDEILSTNKRSGPRTRRGGRPARVGKSAVVAAPVGGIKKNSGKLSRGAAKSVPTGPSAGIGASKVVVSNLPKDVNEAQIKEYFAKTVGVIKRVEISYGPNGVSRGIANIIFSRPDGASKALTALNGLLVDGRPMKIEIVVDAAKASTIPPPKGLSERIAQPKAQPKSAATAKAATNAAGTTTTRGRGARKGRGGRGGRNARPAKKTAEELDSEMADYFDSGAAASTESAAPTNGAAQPAATNGDAMDDEIL